MNLQFDPAHGDTPALFPRHGHTLPAIASADGDLFLFGGTFRGEPRSDLYLFSTRDRSATLLQTSGDKPSNTVGYASVLVGGIMVVWGGKSFASGRPDNTVYLLEIGKDPREWARVTVRGLAPTGRCGHAIATIETKFYVFGGLVGGKHENDLWMMDLVSVSRRTWIQFKYDADADRPSGRTGHICFAYGHDIFVFGGINGREYYCDTWMFNPTIHKWTELRCTGDIPSPRHSHSGTVVEDTFYLFGGEGIGGAFLGDLYAFDIPRKSWFKFGHLDGPVPAGRSGHAMASMGKRIFVVGGKTFANMNEHNGIHSLETAHLDRPRPTIIPTIIPDVYRNLFETILIKADSQPDAKYRKALHEHAEAMASLDAISCLTHSNHFRSQLLDIASRLDVNHGHPSIRAALERDGEEMANQVRKIAKSDSERGAVIRLRNDDAQLFVDLLQTVLDNRHQHDNAVHRLLGVRLLSDTAEFGGGFADVFCGMYKGEKVGLKRLRIFGTENMRREVYHKIYREALLWQRLKHPCILPLLGIDAETFLPYSCLVSPWMPHGTILSYMERYGHKDIEQHIHDIADGLAYLHTENIVHGDIRGNNILINNKQRACLTDFGLTVFANGTTKFTAEGQGSPRWMAPELFSGLLQAQDAAPGFVQDVETAQRTKASDVYAFAFVCVELYTGKPPFSDIASDFSVLQYVSQGVRPARPSDMPDDLWAVVSQCWGVKDSRLSMSEVVEKMKPATLDFSFRSEPLLDF